jgi:Abnormal spindle-like microcephaly-assoc'd, ASPM-SPD-2-Hydin
MNFKNTFLPIIAFVTVLASAHGQLVSYESFSGMSLGNVSGSGTDAAGWTNAGWSNATSPYFQCVDPDPDLTYQFPSSNRYINGGNRALQVTTAPEPTSGTYRAYRTIAPQNTTLYTSFLVRVSEVGTGTDAIEFNFGDSTSAVGRVVFTPNLNGTSMNCALVAPNGFSWGTGPQLAMGSTTHIVIRLARTSSTLYMVQYWVNGVLSSPFDLNIPVAENAVLSRIGFTSYSADSGGPASYLLVDDIRIGYSYDDVLNTQAPEIVVQQPAGTDLVDGASTLSFGDSNIGSAVTKTVTVRNSGGANLTGLAVTCSGTNASDFTLGSIGATTIGPGVDTTFTVTFTPTAGGSRTATLQIASNDTDENPFDINLLGGIGSLAPEIVVQEPVGMDLSDGATRDYGSVNVGTVVSKTIILRNTGTANLTGLAVASSGTHASDFVIGALGATSLAPGAGTSFTVAFTPVAAGSRVATLRIASNDADENPFDISLSGSGVAVLAPEIVVEEPAGTNLVDDSAVLSFGNAGIGTRLFKIVTVRNTGTANLTGLGITLGGEHPADFSTTTLGTSVLVPGTQSTFYVFFQPTEAGGRTATLQISSNDEDENPFDLVLNGSGEVPLAPEIVVEEPAGTELVGDTATLAFGDSNLGVPVTKTITIRNSGTADLTGLVVTRDGVNSSDFALGALGATTLTPGASTTFAVTFTSSVAGNRRAALHIASNDADENPFDITLGGVGLLPPAPEIVVEEPAGVGLLNGVAALVFGNSNIGVAVIKTITVRNTGTVNLTGLAVTRSGANAADFVLSAPGATTLLPGTATTFTVTFTPSAAGLRNAALQIASNDADENPFGITMGGTGVIPPAPEIAVEYPVGTGLADGFSTLVFGNSRIGLPVSLSITIRNTGVANLSGLSIASVGANASDFTVGGRITPSLAPGESVVFRATFTPSAVGLRNAVFQITSNDADENPFDIALSGTGVVPPAPEIVVEESGGANLVDNAAELAFGNSNIGRPVAKTVTVRNTGSASLSGISVARGGSNAAEFVVSTLPASTVVPGASMTFTVTFTPASAGTRSAVLQIASNDADEAPFDIRLTGSGVALAVPEITVQQGKGPESDLEDNESSRNFGSVKVGKPSKAMVFSIRNDGTADLNKLAVTLKGGQAKDFKIVKKPSQSVAPGKSTQFKVTYKPAKAIASRATLQISSNDKDENPFRVTLAGKGVK